MAEDERFLDRWSRRKTVTKGGDGVTPGLEPAPGDVVIATTGDETGEGKAPAVDPKDLPDIDSLDAESDFTVFMREGVPDHIRKLAMRKLWRLDPVFANLDGLLDYDEDFSVSERGLEAVRTVYKVGKGMVGDEETATETDGEVAEPTAEPDAQPEEDEDGATEVAEAAEPDVGEEPAKGDG